MDDTPEELPNDPDTSYIHRYRRRFQALKAIGLGAFLAGIVGIVLWMVDSRKNPCERVRDHLCRIDPNGLQCKTYQGVVDESVHDSSAEMRSNIRSQCQSKIQRLKEEDGIEVK
jgi:hypothetical protein